MKPTQPIHHLRVFPSNPELVAESNITTEEIDRMTGVSSPRRVTVSLADIAPVIADAVAGGRGWLADFADDTVQIDADLYEVLLAYQQMRRFNAA